ncbi:hypothetical protein [Flavobacterium beibuense]|uniref:Lipoprotein n=1 Tax=Flavobacterium beibuense TaxID=657326 RepID=A0A444WF40_9FLAO|nr:hypothetical protein [Flavobacterium beibuense]RYJ44468.1 hypothetical protein NU09_1078 [Flavobacterium beibuense]
MKWLVLFSVLMLTGCSSVQTLDFGGEGEMVIMLNDFNGKVKNRGHFKQSVQVNKFPGYWINLIFKDKEYNSQIDFYDPVKIWDMIDVFETSQLLSQKKIDNYEVNIWQVTSSHPAFKDYGGPFKYIFISRNEGDFAVTLDNYSAFKDNVSEDYLLEEFKKIDFKLNRKT